MNEQQLKVNSKQFDFSTKGDIGTYSIKDVILEAGVNDTVLTADDTEPTGLKWATVLERVATFTSDATPDINSDNYDAVTITALAVAITDVNVTGTPTNFQHLMFRIKDNGTARAIAWGSDFEAGGVALPTTTTLSKTLLVGFIYDSVDNKWAAEASSSRA